VVIGGGKGGKTLAIDLATQGYKAALIERDPEMHLLQVPWLAASLPFDVVLELEASALTPRRASCCGKHCCGMAATGVPRAYVPGE
jgi:2-polyprenyl-6-methoxyphenol hydroxylase-like FAD-dependent oxidoreductase